MEGRWTVKPQPIRPLRPYADMRCPCTATRGTPRPESGMSRDCVWNAPSHNTRHPPGPRLRGTEIEWNAPNPQELCPAHMHAHAT